jgi:hypothetical protein
MNDGFTVNCRHCGEALAVRLMDAPSPCARCLAPDPLDPAQSEQINEARATVRTIAAQEQLAAQRRDVTSARFGRAMATFAGLSWAFFALTAVAAAFSEVPPTLTAKALLKLEQTARGDSVEMAVVSAWWMLFAFAITAPLTLCGAFITLFLLRKPLPARAALAPLEPAAKPRCDLCGAALKGTEPERRCSACGALNTVSAKRQGAAATTLEEQLARVPKFTVPVAPKGSIAPWIVVGASAAMPVLIMLAQQIKLTGEHRTRPELVPIVWALFALASALCLLWLSRWGSPAPSLESATRGTRALVQGHAYTISARLFAAGDETVGARSLTILTPDDPELRPTLALALTVSTERCESTAFELHEGGEEFDSSAKGQRVVRYELEERGSTRSIVAVRREDTRWFDVDPANGAEPRWTMSAVELAPSDIVLLG